MSEKVIKIGGVPIRISRITRIEKRYRLEKGQRIEIGCFVYADTGSVLTTDMKMSEIEDLIKEFSWSRDHES